MPHTVDFLIRDAGAVPAELFEKRFDAIYHLAAYAAECMSPFCRTYNYTNNLLPLAGLLNRVIGSGVEHGRVVLASSIAVYGHATPPFDESMTPRPDDPYGIAKLACEHDLRVAGEQHGIDWCVIRPRNVYGPGQSIWQRYRNVAGLWMRALLEGNRPIVFGDGRQSRAFTYVDDILSPLAEAAFNPDCSSQVINLGSGRCYTLLDLAEALSDVTGASINLQHEPPRYEAKAAWCDTRKSERLLNYFDRTSLRDGLAKMWDWAQNAWELYPSRRKALAVPRPEIVVGMPPAWLEERPKCLENVC